jgi:hypothetical protein
MTSILKETQSSITNLKHLRLNQRNQAHHDEDNMILETSSLFLLIFTDEIFMLDFDDINIKFMSSNSLIEEIRSINDDIQEKENNVNIESRSFNEFIENENTSVLELLKKNCHRASLNYCSCKCSISFKSNLKSFVKTKTFELMRKKDKLYQNSSKSNLKTSSTSRKSINLFADQNVNEIYKINMSERLKTQTDFKFK